MLITRQWASVVCFIYWKLDWNRVILAFHHLQSLKFDANHCKRVDDSPNGRHFGSLNQNWCKYDSRFIRVFLYLFPFYVVTIHLRCRVHCRWVKCVRPRRNWLAGKWNGTVGLLSLCVDDVIRSASSRTIFFFASLFISATNNYRYQHVHLMVGRWKTGCISGCVGRSVWVRECMRVFAMHKRCQRHRIGAVIKPQDWPFTMVVIASDRRKKQAETFSTPMVAAVSTGANRGNMGLPSISIWPCDSFHSILFAFYSLLFPFFPHFHHSPCTFFSSHSFTRCCFPLHFRIFTRLSAVLRRTQWKWLLQPKLCQIRTTNETCVLSCVSHSTARRAIGS